MEPVIYSTLEVLPSNKTDLYFMPTKHILRTKLLALDLAASSVHTLLLNRAYPNCVESFELMLEFDLFTVAAQGGEFGWRRRFLCVRNPLMQFFLAN